MQSDEKSFQSHSLCLFFPKNKGNYKNIGCFRRYVVKISSNYIYNTSMYFRFKLNLSYTTCFKNQSFILRSLLQNWPAFSWFLLEIILEFTTYSVKKVSNYWYPHKTHLWYWQIWLTQTKSQSNLSSFEKYLVMFESIFLFLFIRVYLSNLNPIGTDIRTKYTCGTGKFWFFPHKPKFAAIIFLDHLKNIL